MNRNAHRYDRQVVIPGFGREGQDALLGSKVVVIGTGGLGSPILMYLAAAGIGMLRIVDNDVVDVTNLNRQILHQSSSVGTRKTASAAITLQALNPEIHVDAIDTTLTLDNCETIFKDIDYAVDASDNFETKFLVNDTAMKLGIPCTVGGVNRWDGQVMSVVPGKSACYRCVFSSIPPAGTFKSPSDLGIVGVTAGGIGIVAASEVIKYFLGFQDKDRLVNRLLMMDLRSTEFTTIDVKHSDRCTACGTRARPKRS